MQYYHLQIGTPLYHYCEQGWSEFQPIISKGPWLIGSRYEILVRIGYLIMIDKDDGGILIYLLTF